MSGRSDQLRIRAYEPNDAPAVMALLRATRNSTPSPHDDAFFAWKHQESPFGRSPSWVAESGDTLVGFRTFMRWEFDWDGERIPAVRAVDTATHPDYQGRGIFTRLTLVALEELAASGVAFVFNTPNDKSRPGYLKMGWKPVATLPVLARPRTPVAAARLVGSRVAAERWSLPTGAGLPVEEVMNDRAGIDALLGSTAVPSGLRTHRSAEFLAWRYSFGPLAYRAMLAGDAVADGFALFRLRRRGAVTEATIGDVLLPNAGRAVQARLLRRLLKASCADVAVRLGVPGRDNLCALPGVGPTLVWRGLTERPMPPPRAWHLTLGDVESL